MDDPLNSSPLEGLNDTAVQTLGNLLAKPISGLVGVASLPWGANQAADNVEGVQNWVNNALSTPASQNLQQKLSHAYSAGQARAQANRQYLGAKLGIPANEQPPTGQTSEGDYDAINEKQGPLAATAVQTLHEILDPSGADAAPAMKAMLLPVASTAKAFPRAAQYAENMQKAGMTKGEIWGLTHHQYGVPLVYDPVNKGWRAEISDDQFQLRPGFENGPGSIHAFKLSRGRAPTIGEVFQHPALQQSAPEIWNEIATQPVHNIHPDLEAGGAYMPPEFQAHATSDWPGGLMLKRDLDPQEAEQVGIHELSHAADIAGGGYGGMNSTAVKNMDDYTRNVSEITSRTSERRMQMTPQERLQRHYERDMDVPWDWALGNGYRRLGPATSENKRTIVDMGSDQLAGDKND